MREPQSNHSEEAAISYIEWLYQRVIDRDEKSQLAFDELSKIAMGGHEIAKKFVDLIDKMAENWGLDFSPPESPSPESLSPGVVPKEAWSTEDQVRMDRGEKPKMYPEHPNV